MWPLWTRAASSGGDLVELHQLEEDRAPPADRRGVVEHAGLSQQQRLFERDVVAEVEEGAGAGRLDPPVDRPLVIAASVGRALGRRTWQGSRDRWPSGTAPSASPSPRRPVKAAPPVSLSRPGRSRRGT